MRLRVRAGAVVLAMAAGCGFGLGQVAEGTPAVQLVLTLKGRGVQIYNCQKRPGQAAAWVLRAPEAELLDGSWNDATGEAGSGHGGSDPDGAVVGDALAASVGAAETGSAAAKVDAGGPAAGGQGTAGKGAAGGAARPKAEEAGKVVGHHSAGPVWRLDDGSAVHGVMLSKKDAPEAGAIPWLVLRATEPSGQGALTGVVEIRREETHGGVAPATGCGEATVGVEQRVPYTAMYRFYAVAK